MLLPMFQNTEDLRWQFHNTQSPFFTEVGRTWRCLDAIFGQSNTTLKIYLVRMCEFYKGYCLQSMAAIFVFRFNPRQWRGVDAAPMSFFVMATEPLGRSRGNFAYLTGHPLRYLWQINFDQVRSGHRAMTSQEEQPPIDLSRNSCFQPRNWL